MGLFSRRRDDGPSTPSTDPSSVSDRAESTTPVASGTGPWDVTDAPERPESVGRIDLGSLRVPAVDGMQIRLENPGGIWDELREDIIAELGRAKARVRVDDGEYGSEILAHVPVRTPDGRDGTVAARFIGVDGPRWFLRGVLQGPAATDGAAARALREVFADTVVVRDGAARPPREILPLHAPGTGTAPTAEDLPGLEPLEPGPTIAEVR